VLQIDPGPEPTEHVAGPVYYPPADDEDAYDIVPQDTAPVDNIGTGMSWGDQHPFTGFFQSTGNGNPEIVPL